MKNRSPLIFCLFISLILISNVSFGQNCSNVTFPGSIAGGGTQCTNYDPPNLAPTPATGGSGGSIEYQWQENLNSGGWANIPGETGLAYDPPVLMISTSFRRQTKRTTCTSWLNSTELDFPIIQGIIDPGTITGGGMACDMIDPPNITGTIASGGSQGIVEYQWQESTDDTNWTDIPGATSLDYDNTTSITQTTYYRREARRTICTTWLSSNSIVFTITDCPCSNVTFPGSIAGGGTQCTNYDPPNLAPTPAAGGMGGSIEYRWQENVNSGGWADIPGETGLAYDPPVLMISTTFRRQAKRTDCTDWINSTELDFPIIQGIIDPGTITGGGMACDMIDPPNITGTIASGGSQGTVEYQWQQSTDDTNWTDIPGATSLDYDNTTSITQTTYYRREARRTICTTWLSSNSIVFTITDCPCSNVTFPGSIAGGGTQCTNYDPPNLAPTPASGGSGGSIEYQWQENVNSGGWADIPGETGLAYDPPVLMISTTFRRQAKRTDCTDWINSTELDFPIIQGIIDAGAITGGGEGCSPYNLPISITGTVASGGSQGVVEYQWQESLDDIIWTNIPGATGIDFSLTVSITETIYYRRRARRTVCTTWLPSNSVVYTIMGCPCSNVTFPGSIAGGGTQCTNYDPPNLAPTPATGGIGGSIEYQWQENVNSGGWADIPGEIGLAYDPPVLMISTTFRRQAKRTDCTDWINSTELDFPIIQGIIDAGAITGGGQACSPYNLPVITGTVASGGSQGVVEYQWQESPDDINWTNVPGATGIDFDLTVSITETTHYRRRARRTVCTTWLPSNSIVFNVSNCCQIDATASNVNCNDNGTPSNMADDIFTFQLLVLGTGPTTSYSASGGGWTDNGTIGQNLTAGPILIGSGAPVTININAGSGCTYQLSVSPPASCSNDCRPQKCTPFSVAKD